MEKLAIYGGKKVKTKPYGQWKRFGDDERREVLEALDGNSLLYFAGTKTGKLESKMCRMYGTKYAVACSSGTASVHIAAAALGIGPGDEVLVPSVTDMGSVIGLLYQGAIPVFLDIDADTFNLDPGDIERKATSRTKAIIAVHHMGYPCDMDRILHLAGKLGIYVIEDCAQAWHAEYRGKKVGSMGDVGCFSFNDYKLLSTGEGGICITYDEETAKKARLYTDKGYYRDGSGRKSEFLAPNYRISELCSAVAVAHLDRAEAIVKRRNEIARSIDKVLQNIKGIYPVRVEDGALCTYWNYLIRFEPAEYGITRDEFIEALRGEGIECSGSHIAMPIYKYGIFSGLNAFSGTKHPFVSKEFNNNYSYDDPACPNAQAVLDKTVIIPVREYYTEEDVGDICAALDKINRYYSAK